MKYSLRSLMIVAVVLPPLLAVGWAGVAYVIAPEERADPTPATDQELVEALKKYEKYLESQP